MNIAHSSPIKQGIDSTNEKSSMVVAGSVTENLIDSIDNMANGDDYRPTQITFGHQFSFAGNETPGIAEQDIEESNPNVP